jgi:hypothetical protein
VSKRAPIRRLPFPLAARLVVALWLALAVSAPAQEAPVESPPAESDVGWSKETKTKVLNAAILGGTMAYGLAFWGYGESSFQTVDEGWFGEDTSHGGADKAGHTYSAYVAAVAYAQLYDAWGYETHVSSKLGAMSSLATFTAIEVGDGFSKNGFCLQDLAMDTVGALVGCLRHENPGFRRKVDLRVEYVPTQGARNGEHGDLATDYSGYKYLVALRGDGFDCLSSTWLKYFELQGGYFTRGYEEYDEDHDNPSRNIYASVAVNLSHIFDKRGWSKTATFLRFYQVPYTYVATEKDLNQ